MTGTPKGFAQQRIWFLPRRLRHHVIRCIKIHRIDFGDRHELAHLHHPRAWRRHLFQFVIPNDDVAVALILEAFELGAGNRSVLGLTVEHLFDARMIALVKLVEADGLAAGGSVELDGERDQAEGDLALPNGSWHECSDLATTFALVVGISKARNGLSAAFSGWLSGDDSNRSSVNQKAVGSSPVCRAIPPNERPTPSG
jgi:hypothetical protein